jgi:hypothetical protein
MTYKEFLDKLENLELDLDSAAEALDLDISEIESWEEEDEIPKSAEKWIKQEEVESEDLHNTNEDDDFDDEDEDFDDDDYEDDDEDDDLDFEDEEERDE